MRPATVKKVGVVLMCSALNSRRAQGERDCPGARSTKKPRRRELRGLLMANSKCQMKMFSAKSLFPSWSYTRSAPKSAYRSSCPASAV